MAYARTPEQKRNDWLQAKAFEQMVLRVLPAGTIDHSSGSTDLDFQTPFGVWVEAKEKNQKLTKRWTALRPEVPEEHLFILDEQVVRKALRRWPAVHFVIHNRPAGRLHLAPLTMVVTADRRRVNRNGRGKWLMDLRDFPETQLETLWAQIVQEEAQNRAYQTACVAWRTVEEVPT